MSFKLVVVSPEKNLFEGEVEAVSLSGLDGRFGIQQNHAPMVAALGAGPVTITEANGSQTSPFIIEGGFVRVEREQVLVLSDSAFTGDEIDLEENANELESLNKTKTHSDEEFKNARNRQNVLRAKARFANN